MDRPPACNCVGAQDGKQKFIWRAKIESFSSRKFLTIVLRSSRFLIATCMDMLGACPGPAAIHPVLRVSWLVVA